MRFSTVLLLAALLTVTESSLRAASPPHPRAKDKAESTEIDRVERVKPPLRGVDLVLSTFDRNVVDEFEKSWVEVHEGNSTIESVILILRTATGFQARRQKLTYEYKKCTFPWHPATIAIIHTHPNDSPPFPQPDDMTAADKYHVPIFTLTSRGMFVYDPNIRKIKKVMKGLDWLDADKWPKAAGLDQ